MIYYFLGLIMNIFNHRISKFAAIDYRSKISKKAYINHGAKMYFSNIGEYSFIGPNTKIICADIGKFCSIAESCSIGLANHSMKNISTSPIFTLKKNGTGSSWIDIDIAQENPRVKIGNDVWLGTKVIVMGGVTIGDGAIIGAGSIVTKNIPEYAIAVGVPAKVIKFRFEEPIINKLVEMKWWNMTEDQLKKLVPVFQIKNFTLENLNI